MKNSAGEPTTSSSDAAHSGGPPLPDHSGALVVIVGAPQSTRLARATATRIRNLPVLDLPARHTAWRARLHQTLSPVTAMDAFSGDAWNQIKAGWAANPVAVKSLWVASAGAGLLPADAPWPNHSASFNLDHPDRTGDSEAALQAWWEEWVQGRDAGCGGITGRVKALPDATFLIVPGPDLLSALMADLWEARAIHPDPDRFIVLTGGQPATLDIGASWVRADPRLDAIFGGPRHSLPARITRHLLEKFTLSELRAPIIATRLERLLWKTPAQPPREKSSTSTRKIAGLELDTFVREQLDRHPKATPAALLRLLRATGRTCERTRLEAFHQRHSLPLLFAPPESRRPSPPPFPGSSQSQ